MSANPNNARTRSPDQAAIRTAAGSGLVGQNDSLDRILRLMAGVVPDYGGRLTRLAGDFSAAVAFLLSDPVFDRLGCSGRQFVEFARKAYAGNQPESPVAARRRCRLLLRQSEEVLQILRSTATHHRAILDDQRQRGEALSVTAARVTAQSQAILTTELSTVAALPASEVPADPEQLADQLLSAAELAFAHMRDSWQPVYSELANSSLPPPPLMFSSRQMYIETVKLFNQHRLQVVEPSAGDARGLRGLLGANRRHAAKEGAEARLQVTLSVVSSMADAIRATLEAWQRSALERMQRRGRETEAAAGEAALEQELVMIDRAARGLSSLKRELVQGLSVRHYYLVLLQQAAGCSRSA